MTTGQLTSQGNIDAGVSAAAASYWQGVWARLCQRPPALIALVLIVGLVLLALLGPLVWTVDPARQFSARLSLPPGTAAVDALIVDELMVDELMVDELIVEELFVDGAVVNGRAVNERLENSGVDGANGESKITVLAANTVAVTLQWQPVINATAYTVYRHSRQPLSGQDNGLPLAEIPVTRNTGNNESTGHVENQHIDNQNIARQTAVRYQDRLSLREQAYTYSVFYAVSHTGNDNGDSDENSSDITGRVQWHKLDQVTTTPSPAIRYFDARLSGLLTSEDLPLVAGQTVTLPGHPLGTDHLGRDMLARLLHGLQVSLLIGLSAPLLFVAAGTVLGLLAGYLGGRTDMWLMRLADFVIALPFLLFMILFKVLLGLDAGDSGITAMIIAMVILLWPGTARLVRAQVLVLRELAFVQNARLMGAGTGYVLSRHILPNILGVVMVSLTFAIPNAIFTEAFLSFIGLGVVPPTPSLGSMCQEGVGVLLTHSYQLILPATVISLIVLAFNIFGDALRDALDIRDTTVGGGHG